MEERLKLLEAEVNRLNLIAIIAIGGVLGLVLGVVFWLAIF